MLLLDTNALVWWTTDSRRLGRKAKSRIEGSWPNRISLCIASWYELAALDGHRDIQFRTPVDRMRAQLLGAGLNEIDITGAAALDAAALRGLSRDPLDCMIVATARQNRATLVTSDDRILDWNGDLDRLDARR